MLSHNSKVEAADRISGIDFTIARNVPLDEVVTMHGGLNLKKEGRWLVGACPRCGGENRFFVKYREGIFGCRVCGAGKGCYGAIDFEMHISGTGCIEAARAVLGHSGGHPIRPQPAPAPRTENENYTLKLANRIWRETTDLTSQAIEYFIDHREGIDIHEVPNHGSLRFHAQCSWGRETKPCIIGRFTTVIGNEPNGIWRRPLSGEKPRTLGPQAGCVIRLWGDAEVTTGLVLGEGIETTLAAATRRTHKNTLLQPAWAAGCASNMASFPVLPGVEHLTLLVDHDENGAGERAAEECARRWIKAGREVELLIPNEVGADFNDLIKKAA